MKELKFKSFGIELLLKLHPACEEKFYNSSIKYYKLSIKTPPREVALFGEYNFTGITAQGLDIIDAQERISNLLRAKSVLGLVNQ
jgi:hypothetical protein